MPKTVMCDKCGKEGYEDYDGNCVCEYHDLENKLRYSEEEYARTKTDFDNRLREKMLKINEIKSEMLKIGT
jgi:ribosomal protein L37E